MPDTKTGTLQGFVRKHTTDRATVYTDEHSAYARRGEEDGRAHEAVCHSVGRYVREQAHTNGVESFWATVERGHKGVFHKFSKKHLQRYVDGYAGKHNARKPEHDWPDERDRRPEGGQKADLQTADRGQRAGQRGAGMTRALQAMPFDGLSETATETKRPKIHQPISSVWEGSDGDLLEAILEFYPSVDPEPILDSTHNQGRFWKGSTRRVISMDIEPKFKPMILGDNRRMDGVPDSSFGVVVYDPPHVGPQGRDKSRKRFDEDFGATVACGKEHGWKPSYLYPPFLAQAKRVLRPECLFLSSPPI